MYMNLLANFAIHSNYRNVWIFISNMDVYVSTSISKEQKAIDAMCKNRGNILEILA
jgi:spore coat polysaccharide biosynthesis protein SpsF (cytidylyltransferase family)